MKMRNYFFAAALVVLAASCLKENNPESSEKTTVNYVPMEFTSSVETKTVLDDGKVNWLANDKISIFDNSKTAETHNNSFETTAGDGSFTGTVPEDATEFYALYPYRAASSLTEGAINILLNAEQKAKVGSFADDLAIMVAKAEGNTLSFKNVCSHIKFTLADDLTNVKSITLMGNNAEILAGTATVNMSGTEPVINVNADGSPKTYVTLRNSDGSALTPGDYYFTVLPVNFTKGFTVILSKTDETQVAKTTTNPRDELASRNSILVMKPLAASDYTEHMNYFVKYNDGFDLTFGGVTINNTDNSGGILVNSTEKTTITKDGIYFISQVSPTDVAYNACKNLILIGMDSSVKSSLSTSKTLQPETDENGVILFENLRITTTVANDIISQKKATASPGVKFGNIVFDKCIIESIPRHLIYIINAATSISAITITDCDYSTTATASNVVSFGGTLASSLGVLIVNNCVFYSAGTKAMTDFKVLQGPASTVTSIKVEDNTFADTIIPNAGMIVAGTMSECYVSRNVLNNTVLPDKNSTLVVAKTTQPTLGNITYNYYYTESEKSLNIPKEIRVIGSAGSPVRLSQSPLSPSWKPANQSYGAYTIVPETGTAPTISVGAQRPDTKVVQNSASYRYPATDLGSF